MVVPSLHGRTSSRVALRWCCVRLAGSYHHHHHYNKPGRMIHAEDLAPPKVVTVRQALQAVALANDNEAVTFGEALQSVARSLAGGKPVDFADAAAIQATETCASATTTGSHGNKHPGALSAAARLAAETNVKPATDGGMATVRLRDVLGDDNARMPDKAVTREDAEKVADAARSSAGKSGAGTGKDVDEAVTAAAEMNERRAV